MAGAQHTEEYRLMIGALVRLRGQRGFSQTDMALTLNKQRSYVAKVELCERRLDVVEFCRWVEALDCDPAQFIKMHLMNVQT
jgi:transcriptional regulator with XRE-family HTH domain